MALQHSKPIVHIFIQAQNVPYTLTEGLLTMQNIEPLQIFP